jgi:hypothetical protein
MSAQRQRDRLVIMLPGVMVERYTPSVFFRSLTDTSSSSSTSSSGTPSGDS